MTYVSQAGKTEAKHALESAKQSLKKRSAFSTKMVELVLPQDIVDQVQAGFLFVSCVRVFACLSIANLGDGCFGR